MKTRPRSGVSALLPAILLCACFSSPLRAADEIEQAFRDALYAEEVKGDLETALKAYQAVGRHSEQYFWTPSWLSSHSTRGCHRRC